MCIFTRFRYMCLHEKFKIAQPCSKAALDRNDVLTCPDDPNPLLDDGKNHMCGPRTYGIGVCSSVHCAWYFSILPIGDYGDDKRFGDSTSFEDDTVIVDSPEAREDRVARWYRLLNADQQLDHYQTEYPLPYDQRSTAGRALLEFPYGAAVGPLDSLQWQELNPKLLNPAMLQWCVFQRVLPASVVDGRKSNTLSPLQPASGPFRIPDSHKCPKKHGICKKCGANVGDRTLKEKTLAYRQDAAFLALTEKDRAQEDPRGTVWDPSVDLKWDDEKDGYVKVLTSQEQDLQANCAPYPAGSSDPALAPPMAQQVDSSESFHDQDTSPLVDEGGDTSMKLGFPEGMDWQDFTEVATTTPLVTPLEAIAEGMYWPNQNFLDRPAGDPSSLPQQPYERLRDSFSFDPSTPFTADPSAAAEHIDFALLGSNTGLFSDSDGNMSMSMDADEDYNNQDETASEFAIDFSVPAIPQSNNNATAQHSSSSQNPNPLPHPQVAGPTSRLHSATTTFPLASYEKQVGNFIAEQQIANETHYQPPPETFRIVVQMVRQAAIGGVLRPSYNEEANLIFEQMMQHGMAGLL